MKTPSTELFDLINSLSYGEINGFIKVSVEDNAGAEPEYVSLFKAYVQSKDFDEEAIKRRLKLQNFKRVKHYLQQNLFNYLATLESQGHEREINNLISVANLLMERSLFTQAQNMLEKARKKAIQQEMNYHLLIIDEKLFNVNSHLNNKLYVDAILDGTKEQELNRVLKSIKIEEEYRISLLKRWRFYQQHGTLIREKEMSAKLIKLLHPYVVKGENYPVTVTAKHDYYITAAFYYQEKKQIKKAIECLEKSAKLAEENPREPVGGIPPLIASLNNLVFIYAKYNMLNELRMTLDRLTENLPAKQVYRKVGLVSIMAYESYYCKFSPDYPERRKKLKWIEEDYVKLLGSQRMLRHIQTAMNLSVNAFCDGNFKKALSFITELESYPEHLNFPAMTGLIKVYKLILYYEMGKYDLLAFAFRNTYRYLLKNATYKGFERVVMQTLKKMPLAVSKSEQAGILSKAYHDLQKVKRDAYERNVFNAFNFSGWIKCKQEKKDFRYLMMAD